MNKHNNRIRHLEQRAKKNEIAAIFQLYQNYKNGEYVEKDEEKAEHYFQQLQAQLANSRLILKKLEFRDYRRLTELTCPLDDELTVIIGNNGAGKTAILDAIAKFLSFIYAELMRAGANGRPLQDDDINVNAKEYAELVAWFSLRNNNVFTASLARTKPGNPNKKESVLPDLRLLGELYRTVYAKTSLPLPLFAYYGVDRTMSKALNRAINEAANGEHSAGRLEACRHALDAGERPSDFIKWFLELDNIGHGRKNGETEELENEIAILEKIVNETDDLGLKTHLLSRLNQQKSALQNFAAANPAADTAIRLLKTVISAIEFISPEVGTPQLERGSGRAELYFTSPPYRVNFNQLSKGQQTVIALVADLALRLAKLNPQLENPLHGPGIVMIDEIELHLHPAWQQTILAKLREKFPNIQFIIATHSPFILSTTKPEAIRGLIIRENGEIGLQSGYQFSEGANVQQVVEDILEVSARPAGNPFVEKLEQYLALIRDDKWDSDAAIALRRELDRWGGSHETALLDADMDIQLRKFRRAPK